MLFRPGYHRRICMEKVVTWKGGSQAKVQQLLQLAKSAASAPKDDSLALLPADAPFLHASISCGGLPSAKLSEKTCQMPENDSHTGFMVRASNEERPVAVRILIGRCFSVLSPIKAHRRGADCLQKDWKSQHLVISLAPQPCIPCKIGQYGGIR